MINILNLFASIGGNRELWPGGGQYHITAVEIDPDIAAVYGERFPNDTIIVGDALTHVVAYYHTYDFIWASPPCPSHGQYRHNVGVIGKGYAPIIPDMTSLYGLIVFLRTYYRGEWSVENVVPYYPPLIPPTAILGRNLFWANFPICPRKFSGSYIRKKNKIGDFGDVATIVASSKIRNKRQVLRNCVNAELGAYVLSQSHCGVGRNYTGESPG